MPKCQNGWPIANADQQDRGPLIRDITVPNGVLKGDVAVVFRWLAEQYDKRVERLIRGWCWGWHVKQIEGSNEWSNHSGGLAVDFNAPKHPMADGSTSRTMSAHQINECHAIERESDGVLRWGGDFSRDDPMHWEIVGSRASVKKFADRLRGVDVKEPVMQEPFEARIPALTEGDSDADFSGYNMITRIQRIVGAEDDGVWGPKTTDRIAVWCKLPEDKCKVLTVRIARVIFGLAH